MIVLEKLHIRNAVVDDYPFHYSLYCTLHNGFHAYYYYYYYYYFLFFFSFMDFLYRIFPSEEISVTLDFGKAIMSYSCSK